MLPIDEVQFGGEVVYMTMICFLGLIGNATQLIPFLCGRRSGQQSLTPLKPFMIYLATNDCAMMINSWSLFSIIHIFDISGKYLYYIPYAYGINHYCFAAHIWGMVALSVDRCLAVCYPVWNKTQKPLKFVPVILMATTAISAVYAAPMFFELHITNKTWYDNVSYSNQSHGIQYYDVGKQYYANSKHQNASQLYLIGYRIVAKMIFATCLPVTCLFILTVVMIWTLRKSLAGEKTRKRSNILIRKQLQTATNTHVETLNQILNPQHSSSSDSSPDDISNHQIEIPRCRRRSSDIRLRKSRKSKNQPKSWHIYQPLIVVLSKAIACYSMPFVLNVMETANTSEDIIQLLSIVSNCLVVTEASSNFYVYFAMSRQFRKQVNASFKSFSLRGKSNSRNTEVRGPITSSGRSRIPLNSVKLSQKSHCAAKTTMI